MALNALNKANGKLKFFYRKNKFLTPTLRRTLGNAITQPQFGYACSARYPNLNGKFVERCSHHFSVYSLTNCLNKSKRSDAAKILS